MNQYKSLNVKLSNSQLNKLKSGMKKKKKKSTEVTLKLSSNLVGDSNLRIIFRITCYQVIHKFQRFVKLLQIIPQLI